MYIVLKRLIGFGDLNLLEAYILFSDWWKKMKWCVLIGGKEDWWEKNEIQKRRI